MNENNILGVILAGGKSRRFGEDKSKIKLGNKTLLDKTIPTDKIFLEIAKYYGLKSIKSIPTKLICNNSTSKTPWSQNSSHLFTIDKGSAFRILCACTR